MRKVPFPVEFKFVNSNEKELIVQWLEQAYIKEWLHGQGLKNLLEDLDGFLEGKSHLHEHLFRVNYNVMSTTIRMADHSPS
jgi:hypothetical protein